MRTSRSLNHVVARTLVTAGAVALALLASLSTHHGNGDAAATVNGLPFTSRSAVTSDSVGATGDTLAVDATSGGSIDATRTVSNGNPFTIDIVLSAAPDAYQAFQARFTWDPNILQYTGTAVGENVLGQAFLCGGGTYTPDATAPSLYDGCARTSGTQTNTGVAFTWELECIGVGTTTVHLQTDDEIGPALATNFAITSGEKSATTKDASITCSGGPATNTPTNTSTPTPSNTPTNTSTPTRTSTPTQTPTPTFTSTVTPTFTSTSTATSTPCPTSCDADGDGMPDAYEAAHYCLNPALPDGSADADHDGLTNYQEYLLGSDPCAPDTDSDGCIDGTEVHRTGREGDPLNPYDFYNVPYPALRLDPTGTRDNAVGVTTDLVALLSYAGLHTGSVDYDADYNHNGIPDGLEYDRSKIIKYGVPWPGAPDGAIGITSDVLAMTSQIGMNCPPPDRDGDGIPDSTDPDNDNDGMPDAYEILHSCLNRYLNDASADADHDGLTNFQEYVLGTDPCNADSDGDGIPDGYEAGHTCLNPLANDASGDADGDGVTNLTEYTLGLNPCNPDSDGDGIPDGYETSHACLNPAVADGSADPDQDGLTNSQEYVLGTNPCNADSDGDGLPDGYEATHSCLNPLVNDAAGDADGDTLSNATEYALGTNPCTTDTDSDGMPDNYEVSHSCLNPLVNDANGDADTDALSNSNEYLLHTDPCNPDTDHDGLADGAEVQIGSNPLIPDTDADGCLDGEEVGPDHIHGGQRDPTDPWDFYDVPVPALRLNAAGTRDKAIGTTTDIVALLQYVGLSSSSPDYMADRDGNGVPDGRQYDRTVSTHSGQPWRSEGPDGGIGVTSDVLAMLAQVGNSCG